LGLLILRARRSVVEAPEVWDEVKIEWQVDPTRTALLICDMWDRHWCRESALRMYALAPKIERVATLARAAGVQIIHAPSETMQFYAN
jgi:isochorismate hydrolase